MEEEWRNKREVGRARVAKEEERRRARRAREGEAGTSGRGREKDGAEKRSLPTAPGDAPKTRWTCGAISAPFFSPSSSSSSPPCRAISRAFVSSPILILRGLHGVPETRGERTGAP